MKRKCTTCKQDLDLKHFSKDTGDKFGKSRRCTKCTNEMSKKRGRVMGKEKDNFYKMFIG